VLNDRVACIERERVIFKDSYELVKIYEKKIKTVIEKMWES
jgi:hypothetical protein